MKLKFTIHYRTQWGESMHVSIDFYNADGTARHQNVRMQTQDGETWSVETATLSSRQHSISHIIYNYQVEDENSDEVIRKEWNEVPRLYHVDISKDYVFPDQWRDRPLPLHLYSDAYLVTTGVRQQEEMKALPLPLFRRTIVFRVSAPQLKSGQSVAVCGSHPSIGAWNPSRYVAMQYAGMGEWMLSVDAQGWMMPIEYKYVVTDDSTHSLVAWEDGDNRTIDEGVTADGQVLVMCGGHLRMAEDTWRAAGVSIPVFALRSSHSYGVGDFGDLKRFVDWMVLTGMKIIQILPVNDTTTDGHWHDSHPYNIVSAFALHPHYTDLEEAGTLRNRQHRLAFERRRQELNELPYTDYEAVERVKSEYLQELYAEQGREVTATDDFKAFAADNDFWLKPYTAYIMKKMPSQDAGYISYVQYLLHRQLKAASDYAHSKGIAIKGDLPIGISADSADVAANPDLFNTSVKTGTMPDADNPQGQNWGFPAYRWDKDSQAGRELTGWFQSRLRHMEQYFDALRIDHILGYFRIWEIPDNATSGLLGHFSPSLPLNVSEIEYFGLQFRKDMFTRPFINDRIVERLFGIHAQFVRDNFLVSKAYGLYNLKEQFQTQRDIAAHFAGRTDESSLWIRDGLMQLVANVLFVEDSHQSDMYHPRIGAIGEPIFTYLSAEDKDAYMRLYNNYFYQRHSTLWARQALWLLPSILHGQHMLICAEDLGTLPECTESVLDQLRILTLEIQQMPKHGSNFEFAHLESNPLRSVATISTHDMAPLRLWWQQQTESRQRYYATMLQKQGHAPEQLPAHLAEEILARHLYCPSMLCIFSLQDWLSMDTLLRRKNAQEERINTPSDPFNRWQYRMHLTIEELTAATKYNNKVKTLIQRSRR